MIDGEKEGSKGGDRGVHGSGRTTYDNPGGLGDPYNLRDPL